MRGLAPEVGAFVHTETGAGVEIFDVESESGDASFRFDLDPAAAEATGHALIAAAAEARTMAADLAAGKAAREKREGDDAEELARIADDLRATRTGPRWAIERNSKFLGPPPDMWAPLGASTYRYASFRGAERALLYLPDDERAGAMIVEVCQ